jgi:hypothetical protein
MEALAAFPMQLPFRSIVYLHLHLPKAEIGDKALLQHQALVPQK